MAHFHLVNIRKLLTEALSDETLRVQTYDIELFRPIYRKLTATSKRHEVIELVIEAAQQAQVLSRVLSWVARRNPEIYAKHEPYLIAESDTGEYPAVARPVGNPFSYGNAISVPKRFIGRRREVEQIYSRLHNAEFESSAVVGERRIGKTSLLKYLAEPEIIRQAGFSSKTYLFIYIDLQLIGDRTPSDFWQRILQLLKYQIKDEFLRELIDEVRGEDQIDAFILDDLFTQVDDLGLHIVLLLDEFERVTQNPAFDVDFFSGLRATAIHHNLALIPSSRRELIDLTHSKAVQDSPFFNIFSNVTLKPFSAIEARQLIDTYLTGQAVRFTPDEIDYLLELAGLHPYFLQMMAYFLYEAHRDGLNSSLRRQVIEREFNEATGPMFSVYWDNSPSNQRIVLLVLALRALTRPEADFKRGDSLSDLKRYYQRAERTLAALEKRGLILVDIESENRYRPFSVVFCHWIIDVLAARPGDSNLWRQWQQDYRQPLNQLPLETQQRIRALLPRLNGIYCELIGHWLLDSNTIQSTISLLETFGSRFRQMPGTLVYDWGPVEPEAGPKPAPAAQAVDEEDEASLLGQLSAATKQLDRLNLRAARYTGRTLPAGLAQEIRETNRQIKILEDRLRDLIS